MIETEITFLKITRVVQIPKLALRGSPLPAGCITLRDAQHQLSTEEKNQRIKLNKYLTHILNRITKK
jgi:hypothetical protein